METRSQIQGLEMPKLHAHARQWGQLLFSLEGKRNSKVAKALPHLRTPGTMRVSVAILQCLIDTASSLSLKSAPLSLNTWSSSTVKSHPPPQGQTFSFPMEPTQSPTYPGSSSPTLLLSLSAKPGILTIFIAKKLFPLKRMWSIQFSSLVISPISCYLCRGVFQ